MQFLLASAPLILIVFMMIGWRRSAAVAGVWGAASAALIAALAFDFVGARTVGPLQALAGTALEALHISATVLWIIFPALALYELQARSGAFDRIRQALAGLSREPRILAILIAWFFGLFMEGAAGFGTPVVLVAPLLVGLGFSPVRAVSMALIGHAAGVSFGALGTPVVAQGEITGLSTLEIARQTGLLHGVLGFLLLLFLLRATDDAPLSWHDLCRAALAAVCFLVPFVLLAAWVGPELPTLGGGLVGGVCFVALLRRSLRWQGAGNGRLWTDLAPYGCILLMVLTSRLVPSVQDGLRALQLTWQLADSFGGSFQPLYHPGTILLVGFLVGALLQDRGAHVGISATAAARKLVPVAIALVAMLSLSRIMVHWGMIHTLAEEAARSGPAWTLLAPTIGVLGTFVTGSATASNILFSEFQIKTAAALSLPPLLMTAAQGVGAAIGNIVCPHNIIAGSATVGLRGREGEILTRTVSACAACALAGGLIVLLVSRLG
jgi:lactate permease